MSVVFLGLLTVLIGFAALRLEPAFGFTILFASSLLGSAAALIVPGLASVQPAHLLLGFLLLKVLLERDLRTAVGGQLRFPDTGFWLLCTWTYGVLGAYFLPKLLGGEAQVVAVSSADYANGMFPIPLSPSTGNITQTIYLTGDVVCFFAFCSLTRTLEGCRTLAKAMMIYCVANIGFAALDIITTQTGTTWALEFIRNANYVIYSDAAGGTKRIIGSFTEASAFAYATIGSFCIAARFFLGHLYRRSSMVVALLSMALLLMSNSSTAFVALPPCVAFLYLGALLRFMGGRASANDVGFLLFLPLISLTIVLVVLLDTDLRNNVADVLNVVIFTKALSPSGIERAQVNAQAIQTFFDTHGLGAGVGSVRASSLIAASLSNLGLLSSGFYAAFAAAVLVKRHPDDDPFMRTARSAARCGCLGLLIAASVSAALIDLGLPFFMMAALACARPGRPAEAPARRFSPLLGIVASGP